MDNEELKFMKEIFKSEQARKEWDRIDRDLHYNEETDELLLRGTVVREGFLGLDPEEPGELDFDSDEEISGLEYMQGIFDDEGNEDDEDF